MALTRKFLSALGIDDEKVDEIITAHTETVNALKEARDKAKDEAERLGRIEKEYEDYKAAHADDGENPMKAKYDALKAEYDEFKQKTEAEATTRAKSEAYEALLKEAGISDKRIKSILKVTDLGEIELDADGKIKDAEKRKEAIKSEWEDFVVTEAHQGANTATPPANSGSGRTKEEILAIKDTVQRQQAMAENPELFGI